MIEFQGVDDISVNAWDGTGGLTGFDDHCVISWRIRGRRQRAVKYDVAGYGPAYDGAGNIKLNHTDGTSFLRIVYEWTRNNNTYQITDYSTSGYITPLQTGAVTCADANASGRITITVSAAEVASAIPGIYSAAMRIDGFQQTTSDYVVYGFNVDIPELVEINGLDDINLGLWDGTNDLQSTDLFCVFRNGSGNFSATVTGSHDSGSQFFLSGPVNIPYNIELRQGAGAYSTLVPSTSLPSSSSGFSGGGTQDCGGLDNTEIRITVAALDLANGSVGALTDVVTVLIEAD